MDTYDEEDLAEVAALVRRLLMHEDDDAIQAALTEVFHADGFVPMACVAALAGIARDLLGRIWPDENDPARMEWVARCADVVIS